ncbi:putative peptide modification system cyclase [Dokdonella fugitiva]|uniref:Putative peptide modification system cyclase n=1 Tax=Dokdonella fugitiva TaxID=328517 RepID=A0A4R2IG63_9GAMM|nr:putative peptide modification system cyclase [Dokdonella fugitiva]TCO43387.1 putative peptide modification system cyclase [Dokdonella fugitiva]
MTADESARIDGLTGNTTSVLRTLVLSDLVDSTSLVERLGDQRAADLIRKHDRLARALMQQHGGREIDKTDGFLLVFERPIQAVAYALAYQRELADLGAQEKIELAARIGIHVGDIVVWDNSADDIRRGAKQTEVEGLVKPVAARLMGLALPRQILMSGTAYDIAHRAQGELGEKLARVRWRTHGRYRLKGVPDLVPVFEVGEEGIAPLRAPAWTGKAHREMPVWRRPVAVAGELLALLLLVAVPAWYFFKPAPAIAFANRDWVVVGSLKNLTGHKAFDDSLATAFRIGLEQSRYVNVMPELQVRDVLKRMERDPTATVVDRVIGSEVALREGARALVLPTVAEIGGRVRLTAEVVDPHTQTSVYSDSVEGVGEAAVLPAMDDLLKKMRGRLGESIASIDETSAPLAEVTTRNFDALKAYSLGLQALAGGRGGEALTLFDQAVSLDPHFAQAYLGLANVYYSTSQKAKAHDAVSKAVRDLDHLSVRERLNAQGYAALFETPDSMREKWSMLTKLYPDDMAGTQNLAMVLWQYDNDRQQAAQYFRKVTASQHPRRGYAWLYLGDIEVATEDFAAAAKSYATARQIGSPQNYLDPVNLPIARRDAAAAKAALAKEDTHRYPFFEVEAELRKAAIEVGQGRLADARAATDAAMAIAGQAKLEASRQRARLAGVAIALAQGDATAGENLGAFVADELRRLKDAPSTYDFSSQVHLGLAAMLALRHGDSALAARVLAALGPAADASGYRNLQQLARAAACEARIDKEVVVAVGCLEALLSEHAYYQTRVALLRAYRAAGRDEDALTTARWLAGHRGLATADFIGEFASQVPNLLASDEALVDASELELKTGRKNDARKTLGEFKAAWNSSDRGLPLSRKAARVDASLAQ